MKRPRSAISVMTMTISESSVSVPKTLSCFALRKESGVVEGRCSECGRGFPVTPVNQ
jgi:hypothetical protein